MEMETLLNWGSVVVDTLSAPRTHRRVMSLALVLAGGVLVPHWRKRVARFERSNVSPWLMGHFVQSQTNTQHSRLMSGSHVGKRLSSS